MNESQQLLARYVADGSETAFRELVARYINLVYSVALRMVGGDAHAAEDVTQMVFVNLAGNARKLSRESFLGGWLHRDTCFEASKLMRHERRRIAREEHAAFMNSLNDHSEGNLAGIAPILDEAINLLAAEDRTAILLRFFEQRDFRAVGAALGSNEDAARMRVNRALEKLRLLLQGRGVALSATALGTVLATDAVSAAPAGLAASVAGTVLAGSAVAGSVSATTTILKLMTITKIQAGIASAILVAGVATTVVFQNKAQARQQEQEALLRQQDEQIAKLTAENERLANAAAPASASDPQAELTKLRTEANALRAQTAALPALREEKRQIKEQNQTQGAKRPTPLQSKEENFARMNFSREWLLAFHMYAEDHKGAFPDSFDQASALVSKERKEPGGLMDDFEIVYQGSIEEAKNPATTIMLREKQARLAPDGRWQKAYGFVDGHCEIRTEADGNFDAYEKSKIVARQPQAQ